ncbi:hypothetical protein [Sporosarcina pasteurii]|uniref:Uncharacterized protein n=1 Tax=Sporosarcina pasteurii TaxID=1474 RepID=A0A380C8Q6_SPOPA|nr:hypothetical protein [Sporosarcina pasteurii]MDS9472725.1 hypothetical protein [Sporosarcina pasteurii]QBQ04380.1 hypothetical protein E2C16_01065 [Sporosarcina pasteurii]SUJ15467.1 Uncharacterised protein [Sporosarcina pasteurii]
MKKQNIKNIRMTYYFTSIFITVGTIVVLYLLLQKTTKLSPFILFLSLAGGGLPLGIIGVFVDYKISEFKGKTRNVRQLKGDL